MDIRKVSIAEDGAVSVDGEALPERLTWSEAQLLRTVLRAERVITKELLLQTLYRGADEPHQKIIDVFVCKVRRKLGAHAGAIVTVWGRGFLRGEGYELLDRGVSLPITEEVRRRIDDLAIATDASPDELGAALLVEALAAAERRAWA